jgi:hypothetical protein
MDIRKSKTPEIEQTGKNDEATEDFLIKTDDVIESRRMNESIIFNLVQKVRTIEDMKSAFLQTKTVHESSVFMYLSSYIHTGSIEKMEIFIYI